MMPIRTGLLRSIAGGSFGYPRGTLGCADCIARKTGRAPESDYDEDELLD